MSTVFYPEQIREIVKTLDFSELIEQGFIAYSRGEVVVPPVGEMVFEKPPGDVHIKYGYIKEDHCFVIKVASGFYENYKLDLPSSSGVMLLFSQKSGLLESVLMDEGYLTNVRTAVAGQIAAKYLAPKDICGIGVFGSGLQARLQVEYLQSVTACRKIVAWGRDSKNLEQYRDEMQEKGYEVEITTDPAQLTSKCNLIITATPSCTPLITAEQLLPGTHITAMGSDTPEKQELACEILKQADIVVADSIEQCPVRGEISQALKVDMISEEDLLELGNVIANPDLGRTSDEQLTVADLTGVAVQDIQIAKAVHGALTASFEEQQGDMENGME